MRELKVYRIETTFSSSQPDGKTKIIKPRGSFNIQKIFYVVNYSSEYCIPSGRTYSTRNQRQYAAFSSHCLLFCEKCPFITAFHKQFDTEVTKATNKIIFPQSPALLERTAWKLTLFPSFKTLIPHKLSFGVFGK